MSLRESSEHLLTLQQVRLLPYIRPILLPASEYWFLRKLTEICSTSFKTSCPFAKGSRAKSPITLHRSVAPSEYRDPSTETTTFLQRSL